MDDLILPKIKWPFQSRNHKEVLELNKDANDWVRKFCKSIKNDETINSVEDLNYANFSTRIWHYGSYKRVLAICKLIGFFFYADDYFDVKDPQWTRYQCERMLEIAKNDEFVNSENDNWMQVAFSNVWQSISRLGQNEWKQRFIETLNTWFRTAALEFKYRSSKKIPSLCEYLALRPFSEGAEFCFHFIEFAANKYLSSKKLSNPMFHVLLQHCRLLLFATNDLYSYPKEVKNGDVMNIVFVFQEEYNLSKQEAIYKTVDFIKNEISLYVRCKEQLLALYPGEFDFYLDGLDAMLRGNYDFHFESKRYCNFEKSKKENNHFN